jgi:amidophosphoribosyltransferase
MLVQMADRGPDSAGVAIYRDPAPSGWSKIAILGHDGVGDWATVSAELSATFGSCRHDVLHDHALFLVETSAESAEAWFGEHHPELRVMSAGAVIEIYKHRGPAAALVERFGLAGIQGSHALGHTRMATESRVTTEHSHPFSTGRDLCLVHNGSLSNHNGLRRSLHNEGMRFTTDNDTEVAAAYLTWRIREGATLEQALEGCLEDLDGFYTFAVGTADGFAVLRDPIACKPAVMAETDDWVAMASEFRAIAALPGAADAEVWEPEPARVYSWGGVPVA